MEYQIGEISKKCNVNKETLRYYERMRLIPEPPRTKSGYRMYPKETVNRLMFIKRMQDLGFSLPEIDKLLGVVGASGAGKTYIGCALGISPCRNFLATKYIRLPELLTDLAIARGDGTYKKVIAHYKKVHLLIIDEWLLVPLTMTESRDLLEIIEARHQNASTIFISQFSPEGWNEKINEHTMADAILDRIVHNSYHILIDGEDSMRKKKGLQV